MIRVAVLLVFVGAALAVPFHPDGRVVGGSDASTGSYPFIVSLRTGLLRSHTCGGSLIDNKWVLTAAHCVYGGRPSNFNVIAGIIKLNGEGGVGAGVANIVVHPRYNGLQLVNDIALLELTTPIPETDLIKIIKLEKENDNTIRDCTLIGWGRTSYPGNLPQILQYLPLKTTTLETCTDSWGAVEDIVASQICTLTKAGQGACHGDSGGPLISEDKGERKLIGLVSWGAPCAQGYPDVYTRVASFVNWVNDVTRLNL